MHELVESAASLNGSDLVLNLAGVSRLDCSGVGQLVELYKKVRGSGGELKLANVERRQKHLLELVNLLSVLQVYDSEADAVRSCRECSKSARPGPAEKAPHAGRLLLTRPNSGAIPSLAWAAGSGRPGS